MPVLFNKSSSLVALVIFGFVVRTVQPFTVFEYKTFPKEVDRTKSVDLTPPTERNYLEEIIETRPFLQWLRSAWRVVRSWQPPSTMSLKKSPREESMARFFRVVDLMDGAANDVAGMQSSVIMNFSLLNVWRAIWSNVIDTASFFIPGLNVTWFSGYEPNAANPYSGLADDATATASAAIPTQILPQLDLGDLVGLNSTNTAFSLAGGLVNLPLIVGPGLLGLLGLIGLAAPGKRKDESCRRKDKGGGDDCPWYRRYDILSMLQSDDDEQDESKNHDYHNDDDDGDNQEHGNNRLTRTKNKLDDALDDVDHWLSPSASLRSPPALTQQLSESRNFIRSARWNNKNPRQLDSGESEERHVRQGSRNNRRRDQKSRNARNHKQHGANNQQKRPNPRALLSNSNEGKSSKAYSNKPAPPDYVDEIGEWAERPPSTIAPPAANRKQAQNAAKNSKRGPKVDNKGTNRSRLPLYKPPGVTENQHQQNNKDWTIEDYGGIATTVRVDLDEVALALDKLDLTDPSLFFDDDLGPDTNNYLQQSAVVQNLLSSSSPGAQYQVQSPAALPVSAGNPLQQLTLSGVGLDSASLNQVSQQYQNGYFNFDTSNLQTPGSQAGQATAGGYPFTAQQLQLTGVTSTGGGQGQQQQQQANYYTSAPAASNYPQNRFDTANTQYDNNNMVAAASINNQLQYNVQTNPSSNYQYNQPQQQQSASASNVYQQQQQQPSNELAPAGYTNYGAAILARGSSGIIAPELTAGNQLHSPTYSDSYSTAATSSPAAAVSAVGPGAGYQQSAAGGTGVNNGNSAYSNAGYDQSYQSQLGNDFIYATQQQQQQQQQQQGQQTYQQATARADENVGYHYYGASGSAGNYGHNGYSNYG